MKCYTLIVFTILKIKWYYLTTDDEIPENFSHYVKGDQRS